MSVQSDTSQPSDAISSLAKELESVFQTRGLYRRLLGRARDTSDVAQKLLDSFQRLLDEPDLERRLRRNLIVATQRLSNRSGLYPACHELKDVEQLGNYPVTSGGFADIYKGMFQGKVVCMKVIRLYETSKIEHVLKKFSNEVLLWRQLLHPNIVTIYGLYKFQHRLALVMPWMENGDLTKYLNDYPDAPRPLLVKDVAQGLSYLHKEGVIHGDLKGANILVDNAGRARLADFGTSIVSDPQILAWTTQSEATSQGGTVRWQAPELFAVRDGEKEEEPAKTTASDVYAFGCVCLEIFTNKIPFAEISNHTNVMFHVQNGLQPSRPPKSSLCWISWGLTEEIWSFVKSCWAKNPCDRPGAYEITEFFNASYIQDFRRSPETDWMECATFRNKVNNHVNVIGVEELHHMLTVTEIPPTIPSNDVIHVLEYDPSSEDIGDSWPVTYNPSVKQRIALDGPVQTLKQDCYVYCIRISHDGKFLAAGGFKFARIFDTTTAVEVYCFPHKLSEEDDSDDDYDSPLWALSFSRDGKYLATGEFGGLVRIWDIGNQRVHRVFNGSNSDVWLVEFSSDGDFLVSVHRDSTVEIWYMSDLEPKALTSMLFSDLHSPVGRAALSPNDQFIALCQDSTVYIWDITTQQIVDRLEHKSHARAVAFNQNGDGLVSGDASGTLKYWDLTNLLNTATGTLRQAKRQKLEGEGNWGGARQPDEVRSLCVREFITDGGGIDDVVISHDGQWAVSSSYRRVYIWDIYTGIAHIVIDLSAYGHDFSINITSEGLLATTRHDYYDDGQNETRIWRFNTLDETKQGEGKRIRSWD